MAQSKGLQGTCRKLVGWLVAVLSNQTRSPKEEPLILGIRRGEPIPYTKDTDQIWRIPGSRILKVRI